MKGANFHNQFGLNFHLKYYILQTVLNRFTNIFISQFYSPHSPIINVVEHLKLIKVELHLKINKVKKGTVKAKRTDEIERIEEFAHKTWSEYAENNQHRYNILKCIYFNYKYR